MRFLNQRIWMPLGLAALLVLAWQAQGWSGVALVGGGVVMWGLLHFYRMTTVLRRAANNPVGWVGSAVMLQARMQAGQNLLHILAITRALGEQQPSDQPATEVYRWIDNGGASVTCTFVHSRLTHWTFERPSTADTNDAVTTDGTQPVSCTVSEHGQAKS